MAKSDAIDKSSVSFNHVIGLVFIQPPERYGAVAAACCQQLPVWTNGYRHNQPKGVAKEGTFQVALSESHVDK